jgi:hypothetical protein
LKSARYEDIRAGARNFYETYKAENINWNFYHTLKYKGIEGLDKIFFPDGKKNEIANIFGKLSESINKDLTTFSKSIRGVTNKDYLRVRETVNSAGDYFNQGVQDLLGRF